MRVSRLFCGVPVHPLLVHFPIVFWLAALTLDALAVAFGPGAWWTAAFWATVAGVVVGALAIATGLLEYLEPSVVGIDLRLAARHGIRTTLAWCVFAAKTIMAVTAASVGTGLLGLSLALDVIGCALLVHGVYLGTKQVYDQLEGR